MKQRGLLLYENTFCELVACGEMDLEAYSKAFSFDISNEKSRQRAKNRASRLRKRDDIESHIAELKRARDEAFKEQVKTNAFDTLRRIHAGIEKSDERGTLFTPGTLKAAELELRAAGMFQPMSNLNVGVGVGVSGNVVFTPRGVEGMSDEDLRAIIDQEERTVEAEVVEGDEDSKRTTASVEEG